MIKKLYLSKPQTPRDTTVDYSGGKKSALSWCTPSFISSEALEILQATFLDEVLKMRRENHCSGTPTLDAHFTKEAQKFSDALIGLPRDWANHEYAGQKENRLAAVSSGKYQVKECIGILDGLDAMGSVEDFIHAVRRMARDFLNSPAHKSYILANADEEYVCGVGLSVATHTQELSSGNNITIFEIVGVYITGEAAHKR